MILEELNMNSQLDIEDGDIILLIKENAKPVIACPDYKGHAGKPLPENYMLATSIARKLAIDDEFKTELLDYFRKWFIDTSERTDVT